MSSIISAVCANSSLTSIPLWPYFWNLNGERIAAPVLRSVGRLRRHRLAVVRSSIGLGSKVSTCDGPPFMNRWTTRLALAGSGGGLGQERVDRSRSPMESRRPRSAARADRPSRPGSASRPPGPARRCPCPSGRAARDGSGRRLRGGVCGATWRPASGSRQSTNMNSLVSIRTWANCSQGESGPSGAARGRRGRPQRPSSSRPVGSAADELHRHVSSPVRAGRTRRYPAAEPSRMPTVGSAGLRGGPTRPAGAPACAGMGCSSGTGPVAARS